MLDVGDTTKRLSKKKKLKLAAVRRTNQRYVERLVQKVQSIIYKVPASVNDAQCAASQPLPDTAAAAAAATAAAATEGSNL